MFRAIPVTVALAVLPAALAAQQHAPAAPSRAAPAEARQFDFLLGQWELTVKPKVTSLVARLHGAPKLVGSWKAWRAFDGWGIEDELRIMDLSGNPMLLAATMRAFDPAARQWAQSGLDVYRNRFVAGEARWAAGVMEATTRGTDAEGKPTLTRLRFSDIGPDAFKVRQDRSSDNGAKWEEGVLQIEARRVGPAASR
ncbi:MAG: hypothetical protein AB7L66_10240 [Gemmatimonadales bacterium]